MDTKNQGFLDLLPAPFATLDSWRMTPPFPLLGSGRYLSNLPVAEYDIYIDHLAQALQEWDEIDLDLLFRDATHSYGTYRTLVDKGVPETDQQRTDFARIAYQLCLNFRDAVEHFELHDDDDTEFGFHFAVEVRFYTDPE